MKLYVLTNNGVDLLDGPYVTKDPTDSLTTFAGVYGEYYGDSVMEETLLEIAGKVETDGWDGCYSDMHDYLLSLPYAQMKYPVLGWEVEVD